jgi:hypothetical protein
MELLFPAYVPNDADPPTDVFASNVTLGFSATLPVHRPVAGVNVNGDAMICVTVDGRLMNGVSGFIGIE